MNKTLTLAVLLFISILLLGCSNQDDWASAGTDTYSVAETTVEITAAESSAPIRMEQTQRETEKVAEKEIFMDFDEISLKFTTKTGYDIETRMRYSPLISYEDKDALDYAWRSIDHNKHVLPDMESWKLSQKNGYVFTNAGEPNGTVGKDLYWDITSVSNMYYVIGSFEYENKTSGFDFSKENPSTDIYSYIRLTGLKGYNLNDTLLTQVFYSEPKLYNCFLACSIGADMYSNSWGPVTFVIAFPEEKTPNCPEGTFKEYYKKYKDKIKINISRGRLITPWWNIYQGSTIDMYDPSVEKEEFEEIIHAKQMFGKRFEEKEFNALPLTEKLIIAEQYYGRKYNEICDLFGEGKTCLTADEGFTTSNDQDIQGCYVFDGLPLILRFDTDQSYDPGDIFCYGALIKDSGWERKTAQEIANDTGVPVFCNCIMDTMWGKDEPDVSFCYRNGFYQLKGDRYGNKEKQPSEMIVFPYIYGYNSIPDAYQEGSALRDNAVDPKG